MKEVIGKGKFVNKSLPKHIILSKRNFLIKKALPIVSMSILSMLDGN